MLNIISLLTETAFLELKDTKMPFYATAVAAGFPSPADDFLEKEIDLNEYLIRNKAATFLARVEGDSMEGCGIQNNDILIVDRSIKPQNGDIVVASLDGEFTVKRLEKGFGKLCLHAENPKYKSIEINECSDFRVWGVVKYSIRHHDK